MTNQLTLHLPGDQSLTFESDIIENIAEMADFCKEDFDAYSATEKGNELTIDRLTPSDEEKLTSKAFLLGLAF